MRLKNAAESARVIAVVVDVLDGRLEIPHACAVLRTRPETLEKILHEIRELRARRRGEPGHLR
jgi:hypothetical protein